MPNCPKCGSRNPDDAVTCAQCGSALLDVARSEETLPGAADVGTLVELATFHTLSEADMVQELLETNGITSVLHGENDPIGARSGAEPMILLVEKRDLASATDLYQAYFSGDQVAKEDSPRSEDD